jgi:FAD/FMN-containing dehydrogenase
LSGHVIWPRDAEYETARWDFNTRLSRFPAVIAVCDTTEDVQNAVRWARQQGLPLRARSGGHSYEAFSLVDDGLVIDVSGMHDVVVDAGRGEAVIGAGARLLDIYRALGAQGFALSAGTCPTVGIAGLTLGGGVGFLSRGDGLTCDNLLAVDLVDAAGDVLRASDTEHRDLFWALRGGGGGNFGIATAFTFRVRPLDTVVLCEVTWPWDDVAEVLDAWQRWAPFVDERLVAGLVVPAPSQGVVSSEGQFAGDAAELPVLLAPLLQAGHSSPPRIRSLSFVAAAEYFAGPPVSHSTFKNTGAFVDARLPPAAIDTLVAQMRAAPSPMNVVGCFPWGGAIAAVDAAATAFPYRHTLFDLQYQAYWRDADETEANVAWVRDFRTAMLPSTHGTYVNYIDADIPDWATAYYGPNLARLVQVKAQYDPADVFNGPQSVPTRELMGMDRWP